MLLLLKCSLSACVKVGSLCGLPVCVGALNCLFEVWRETLVMCGGCDGVVELVLGPKGLDPFRLNYGVLYVGGCPDVSFLEGAGAVEVRSLDGECEPAAACSVWAYVRSGIVDAPICDAVGNLFFES